MTWSSHTSSSSYYDIDTILSEEELIPCVNALDFSQLAHLDASEAGGRPKSATPYLPKNSKIKMPIWSLEKWSKLCYVGISVPRHFGKKTRERLQADPGDTDLRKRNERFFLSGRSVVQLVERSAAAIQKHSKVPGQVHQAMRHAVQETDDLRETLLSTFSGERLRKTLDWSLSSTGDDVHIYTKKLTEMEKRLFQVGASAISAHILWKTYGNSRIFVSETAAKASALPQNKISTRNRSSSADRKDDNKENNTLSTRSIKKRRIGH